MSRRRVPAKLRKATLERDGHSCMKCGAHDALECHHIVAVADGGQDAIDNCATLCQRCHIEWHAMEGVYMESVGFSRWLLIPRAPEVLLTLYGGGIGELSERSRCRLREKLGRDVTDDDVSIMREFMASTNGIPQIMLTPS